MPSTALQPTVAFADLRFCAHAERLSTDWGVESGKVAHEKISIDDENVLSKSALSGPSHSSEWSATYRGPLSNSWPFHPRIQTESRQPP
jgi:hypothetical protein